MRIAAEDAGLDQRHVVVARLEGGAQGLDRPAAHQDRDVGGAQRRLQRAGQAREVERRRLVGDEHRRLVALGPAAVGQEAAHLGPRTAEQRAALATRPHARRQERLHGHRRALERHADHRGIEGGRDRVADLLPRKRLLLRLEREIADAQAGRRECTGHPPRRTRHQELLKST